MVRYGKEKKEMYPNQHLIPYFLYYDGFETGNPLSSRAGKQSLSAFYYSFPCLPINSSKLDSTFVAMLLKSEDHKNVGNKISMKKLVHIIKKIRTGWNKFQN